MIHSTISEIQVKYATKVKYADMPVIGASKDVEPLLRALWSDTMEYKEEFYILLLNKANRVRGYYKVSEGGMTGTVVDPKIIFSIALKSLCCAIILAHNHPSGNLKPSNADIALTSKLKEGGKLLEISVLDHIIITAESYFSFADEGMM